MGTKMRLIQRASEVEEDLTQGRTEKRVKVVTDQMILAKRAKLLLQKTKTTKNANKARKAKVKKVGLDLDPSVPDPPAQTANPTQIQVRVEVKVPVLMTRKVERKVRHVLAETRIVSLQEKRPKIKTK